MRNSAIITLFCGHYRGREEAFVERVRSGWIDYLPNSKDVLCFGNFSLSLIFLCKLPARDHENMAVVEAWPLVKIRPYFLCASREGASQRGRRKHSSLKEQVSRGSWKNCIVEGWISCALIRPGKEDEEILCWCATFKSLFYLFIYLYSEATQGLRAVKHFQARCNLFLSFFSQIFLSWAAQVMQEKKFKRYYQEFSLFIPQHLGDLDLMSFEPKRTQLMVDVVAVCT